MFLFVYASFSVNDCVTSPHILSYYISIASRYNPSIVIVIPQSLTVCLTSILICFLCVSISLLYIQTFTHFSLDFTLLLRYHSSSRVSYTVYYTSTHMQVHFSNTTQMRMEEKETRLCSSVLFPDTIHKGIKLHNSNSQVLSCYVEA